MTNFKNHFPYSCQISYPYWANIDCFSKIATRDVIIQKCTTLNNLVHLAIGQCIWDPQYVASLCTCPLSNTLTTLGCHSSGSLHWDTKINTMDPLSSVSIYNVQCKGLALAHIQLPACAVLHSPSPSILLASLCLGSI